MQAGTGDSGSPYHRLWRAIIFSPILLEINHCEFNSCHLNLFLFGLISFFVLLCFASTSTQILMVAVETLKSLHGQDLAIFNKMKKKRERQNESNLFYYQIISAILFGLNIVLPYLSGIYGVPSMCLELG